jgi:hypothetical protein
MTKKEKKEKKEKKGNESNYDTISELNICNRDLQNPFGLVLSEVQANNRKTDNLTDSSDDNTKEDSKEKKESRESKEQFVSDDKTKSLLYHTFKKKKTKYIKNLLGKNSRLLLSKNIEKNEIFIITKTGKRPRPDNYRDTFIRMVYNSIIKGIKKILKISLHKGTNNFYRKIFPSIRGEKFTIMTIYEFLIKANKRNELHLKLALSFPQKNIITILNKDLYVFIDFYTGKKNNSLFNNFTTLEEDIKSKKIANKAYFKIVSEYFNEFQKTEKRKENKRKKNELFIVKRPRTYNLKNKVMKKEKS